MQSYVEALTELENKLGLRKTDRINYGGKDYKLSLNKDEKDAVEKSENEYSLFQLLETWLERTPFLQFEGFDFWDQYSVAVRSLLKNEKSVIKIIQTIQKMRWSII